MGLKKQKQKTRTNVYLVRVFPESALKPLHKLLWLSLDNNNIEDIRNTHHYIHKFVQKQVS